MQHTMNHLRHQANKVDEFFRPELDGCASKHMPCNCITGCGWLPRPEQVAAAALAGGAVPLAGGAARVAAAAVLALAVS